MSKRIFVLLLVLMSVSLIGIIFIQYFFILKNYEENNKQFSINVNYVLEETTSDVERNEFRKYVRKFRDLIANEALVDVDTLSIQNLIIIDENPEKRETIIYKNGVIEENLIIPKTKSYYDDIIDVISERENISIKRLSNQREEKVFSNRRIEDNLSPEQFLLKVGKISKSKEVLFESAYNDISKRNPIEERIGDINKFEKIIERNLERMNINLDFEYGSLACLATTFAVYGISCIKPFAPAQLFALRSNSLSCLIIDKIKAASGIFLPFIYFGVLIIG